METLSSFLFILCLSASFCCFQIWVAADNITLSQSFNHGMTLNSTNGFFQLGFFTAVNSNNQYLGIWYKDVPVSERKILWVANREAPIRHPSPVLKLNSTGHVLLLSRNTTIWSASPSRQVQSPILQLMSTGNLVLREQIDENSDNYLWQSFDHPSDTLLPGMKLGKDFRTGIDRYLTSWRSEDDPTPGNLTWGMHMTNYPEPVMWLNSKKYFRSGPWNGLAFSGKPMNKQISLFQFKYISNENETYYMYYLTNDSAIALQAINQTTLSRQPLVWLEAEKVWKLYVKIPRDSCDIYGHCGPNGKCNFDNSPAVCECLQGFRPKSPDKWKALNFSDGCVLDSPLTCQNDYFVEYEKLKMPDTTNTWLNQNMTLSQCKEKCLSNCSCMAYTNSDINGAGSGCALWFGDLSDMRVQPDGGQILYVRLPSGGKSSSKVKIAVIVVSIVAAIALLLSVLYFISRRKQKTTDSSTKPIMAKEEHKDEDLDDLPLFDLSTISIATDSFSFNKKLGEGGFGPVYMGTLEDGREIAVKRLSKTSGQGVHEFKNEVILIAKLQHRNLVKLLGCCIEDKERLLVYEYMPNKSLDSFLFDEKRGKLLDWSKRFHIISGIARGLLYLHQDSRLRIIHRDLKASNVLLDKDMNPKISDFGMARTFGGDQTAANTDRVVGTYGYMAPEYAIDGNFSVKSDVFSFGVLVLEIVTGKKSRGFYSPNNNLNLIALAWNYWKEQKHSQLIDESIKETCNVSEALRCIHISLLCIEHDPADRPSMSSVVMMLSSKTALREPQEPGFLLGERTKDGNSSSCNNDSCSVNGMSITILEAR